MAAAGPWVAYAFGLLLLLGALHVVNYYFLQPLRLIKHLKSQGVRGFPFRPFVGQIPEMRKAREAQPEGAVSPMPFFDHASKLYGSVWYTLLGPYVRLVLADPVLVRQAYVNNNDCYHKTRFVKAFGLFGNGLVVSAGDFWARQRRLINPAFNHKEIKRMYALMVSCTMEAIHSWNQELDAGAKELDMFAHLGTLALHVIGKTAFGADLGASAADAEEILRGFRSYFGKVVTYMRGQGLIPLYRYFPTKLKREIEGDERLVRKLMMKLIEARRAAREKKGAVEEEQQEVDLLELMLSATDGATEAGAPSSQGPAMTDKQLMDESVTFLVAGHETTTNLLTWTMMLLSNHPEWQDTCRKEALEVCGPQDPPAFEHLNQLKNINMVLHESLRLYPPASVLGRTCVKTNKLGEIEILKGLDIALPISHIHRRKDLWGEDAEEFKPERFANGVSKAASHPMAFLPFSVGPRTCIGQNFALVEAKLMLAVILQNYEWRVAPGYRHAPDLVLTLKPKYGMPVYISKRSRSEE